MDEEHDEGCTEAYNQVSSTRMEGAYGASIGKRDLTYACIRCARCLRCTVTASSTPISSLARWSSLSRIPGQNA